MIEAATARPAGRSNGMAVKRVRQLVPNGATEHAPMRNSDATPIRPERICREISDVLPQDGVVVSDTGHAGIWTAAMLELNNRDKATSAPPARSAGDFPAALGVKCALPDRPVVCFTGDGGFYYHIAELETARRHNINAVIVVNNNPRSIRRSGSTSCLRRQAARTRRGDVAFPRHRFRQGRRSLWLRRHPREEAGELAGALKKAIAMNRPVVVDVVTDMYAIAKKPWTSTGRDFHYYQKTGA